MFHIFLPPKIVFKISRNINLRVDGFGGHGPIIPHKILRQNSSFVPELSYVSTRPADFHYAVNIFLRSL